MRWYHLIPRVLLVLAVSADLALAQAQIARYRELPYGGCRFATEQFGMTLDPFQEETLIAFANPHIQRISLQACAGPGKTAIEAICGWYFIGTQGGIGEHPKGLCTAVTRENLRDNLWSEFSKWQARSEYLRTAFTWSAQRIFANDHPETWWLSPRAWPRTGNADQQGATFSGLHSPYVAVFIDESGGIPSTVLRAGEQALANTRFGKILQGGNPISLEGMLYEAATKLRHLWHIIKVTGDPDDAKAWVHSPRVVAGTIPGAQSPADWAREQIATYGRDNPWVMSYILGQFPPTSLNALLGIEEVEAAMARVLHPDEYTWSQKRLGVDVARFGDDRSVIFARQGLNAQVGKNNPIVMRTARTTDIAARVAMAVQRWGPELTIIDDTGHWGHGVIDNLHAIHIPTLGIQFHGKAIDNRYFNRRAEMWLTMAAAVKAGAALPNRPELVAELTTPTYTFAKGAFRLEEKDQIKKRLGRSPDLADGLALTYALPDMPAAVLELIKGPGAGARVAIHHDPYAAAQGPGAWPGGGHALTDFDPYGGDT